MAYNSRAIKVDVDGKPIPQYFDPLADEYKPLLGQHGASRSILYGPDGNPISSTNPLGVRAQELEALIGALNDSAVTNPANAASVIAALKGLLSVVGKEATLGQILSALAPLATESTLSSLASAVAKETTLAQVLSALGALATETTLGGVKTAVDVLAGTVDTQAGVQKVALSGRKPTLTQIANNTVVTAGAEVILHSRSGMPDVDMASMLVVSSVAHAFSIRIVCRPAAGIGPGIHAWADVVANSNALNKAIIARAQLPFSFIVEYRVKNNSSEDQTYNAWVQEWVR